MDGSSTALRRLRRLLIWIVIAYSGAGTASQKLVPGVDEIFPFFGWSLFSRVPSSKTSYRIRITQHNGREIYPPELFLRAPTTMVTGNRYIARKLIQNLGQALQSGDDPEVTRLRRLLEQNYLKGQVRYELTLDRYRPLEKWRGGASEETRCLARFASGSAS